MNSDTSACKGLREMELEVEAEGREWMRRRLEEKLQTQAQEHGAVFPPERTQSASSAAGNDAAAHRVRSRKTARMAREKSR
jgi:hypothetical protein